MQEYHIPVMVNEVISNLITNPDGIYVDLTFGGGGHSKEILKHISKKGILISFDCDNDAEIQAEKIKNDNFIFIKANMIFVNNFLTYYGINKVDGIFADLGVSSYQIDSPSRGFSTRFEGPLDMRMNTKTKLTANMIVNKYSEKNLEFLFKNYGEINNAKNVAKIISTYRKKNKINTTKDLKDLLLDNIYCKEIMKNRFLSQVFQALRIEVNDEINNLKKCLSKTKKILNKGGRLVFISYHSLEDRIVKQFFNFGDFKSQCETDFFYKHEKIFKIVTKKVITPTNVEIENNIRSRSAKLRVCEKL